MAALGYVDYPERGVLMLDETMTIVSANQRAAQVFGMPMAELIGTHMPSIITRQAASPDEVIEEVLDSDIGDGAVIHRYSSPVYTTDGHSSGRIEIYSDITNRRKLEHEILDRNRQLADLNTQLAEAQDQLIHSERLRTLGEMAAGVAHDINNVLGIILGNVQLARRKLTEDSPVIKCVDAIEFAARDAAETVRRLREIGKPVDRSSYGEVDLAEIAAGVIDSALPAWRESDSRAQGNVHIETDLRPGCVVTGNASELREALANVLLNAAQAIESDGRITVSTRRGIDHTDLIVSDTGIGMSQETRERLLDPFFTTRGADGTGLGMSMVDAIALRHRARLIVESAPGEGTTITMRFPAVS